jgi:hypothetical protein
VALVHMNGRVYDPQTGRFMSVDPFAGNALDTQALNRYSYVGNNPLAYTDPSGFFLKGLFKAAGKILKAIWKPVVTVIVAAVMTAVMPYLIPTLAPLGTLGSIIGGALTGLVSSAITSGFDLRSMLIGTILGGLDASGIGDWFGDTGMEFGSSTGPKDHPRSRGGSHWDVQIGRRNVNVRLGQNIDDLAGK